MPLCKEQALMLSGARSISAGMGRLDSNPAALVSMKIPLRFMRPVNCQSNLWGAEKS